MTNFNSLPQANAIEPDDEVAIDRVGSPTPLRMALQVILDKAAESGGDISQETFDAEVKARTDGDDLQAIVVTTAGQLATALASQATSVQPLFISFRNREPFTASGATYNHGDLIYVPPRSNSPERIGNVAALDDVDAGDTWQELSAGSDASLLAHLRQHADRSLSSNAALVHITANFTTATRSYVKDQRWYVAPHLGHELTMVLVHDPSAGGGLTPEQAAQLKANTEKLADIPFYPAQMAVWPPNVAKHSDLQRSFKAVLNQLDERVLRLEGGATGTRFVNRFQIKTRNADRAEVLLHDQAWSYTEEGAQELEWAVDAAEFNQLGTEVSTDYIEVWGEFRAVYGGGINEVRGRTQPFVIGFGEEDEWPASRGDLKNLGGGKPRTGFGLMQVARTEVIPGYTFTGYATTLPSGSLEGDQSEPISGIYTATVRTTSDPDFAAIEQGKTYFAQSPSGNPSVPLYVLIDGVSYDVQHNTSRFYEIVGFAGFKAAGTHQVQVIFTNGRTWIQNPLSRAQQIALLSVIPDPAAIAYSSADDLSAKVKNIAIRIANPELLEGDVWVEGWIQGQPGTGARTRWASNIAGLNIALADASADAVSAAVISNGDNQVEVRLRFYDAENAGNEIERIGMNIPVVQTAKSRFERAVGGSPAVLPEGSHSLYLLVDTQGDSHLVSQTILLSETSSGAKVYWFRSDGGNESGVSIAYAPDTRTLTYRLTTNGLIQGITAIGEA